MEYMYIKRDKGIDDLRDICVTSEVQLFRSQNLLQGCEIGIATVFEP